MSDKLVVDIMKSHYYEIQRDVQPHTLATVMNQHGLLSEKEFASIISTASRDEAADQLIRSLAGKGKEALVKFVDCLKEDNSKKEHNSLADDIQKDLDNYS